MTHSIGLARRAPTTFRCELEHHRERELELLARRLHRRRRKRRLQIEQAPPELVVVLAELVGRGRLAPPLDDLAQLVEVAAREELRELRRRVKAQDETINVLKKATAFFASDHR